MTETVAELLTEMAHDNPRPEEPWTSAESFDPQFKKGTLRAAARRKLIELDTTSDPWRFRFTEKGRDHLDKLNADAEAANG